MIMKYITAGLIVLGFSVLAGAAHHEWLPMMVAQIALGGCILFAGALCAEQIDDKEWDK